eukprot:8868734-Pyramimonas_sp.AAC.1
MRQSPRRFVLAWAMPPTSVTLIGRNDIAVWQLRRGPTLERIEGPNSYVSMSDPSAQWWATAANRPDEVPHLEAGKSGAPRARHLFGHLRRMAGLFPLSRSR